MDSTSAGCCQRIPVPPMKIVHAASELFPYMKTGGLADVVGALTGTFAEMGHEVSAFLRGYPSALAHPVSRDRAAISANSG